MYVKTLQSEILVTLTDASVWWLQRQPGGGARAAGGGRRAGRLREELAAVGAARGDDPAARPRRRLREQIRLFTHTSAAKIIIYPATLEGRVQGQFSTLLG